MNWASRAKAELREGREAVVIPHGGSMRGRVESGQRVKLKPAVVEDLKVGDVVLVRCKGNDYLHLIKAIQGPRFQIGNNRGGINGWVGPKAVYGVMVE